MQDSQEFFKLLLSTLEKRLQGASSQVRLHSLLKPCRITARIPGPYTALASTIRGGPEAEPDQCGAQAVSGLVPALFRGESSYETRCQACGRLSEGSHRSTGFYELDVQVKDSPTLEYALVRLLSGKLCLQRRDVVQ